MSLESTRRAIVDLWAGPLDEEAGVLQVAAVARQRDGGFAVIRVGDGAPASEADFFALSVARARADAIVTTGAILRAEPEVTHDPGPELRAWREAVLGKRGGAKLVVLTRGHGVPLEHPALQRTDVVLATSREGAAALRHRLGTTTVEILSMEDASPRSLLRELRCRGLWSICVEAGPSSSAGLYAPPCAIDELLLSSFEGGPLPEPRAAGRFPSEPELRRIFGPPLSEVRRLETSGPWTFRRYRRPEVGRG